MTCWIDGEKAVIALEDAIRTTPNLDELQINFLREFKLRVTKQAVTDGVIESNAFYRIFIKTCSQLGIIADRYAKITQFFLRILKDRFEEIDHNFVASLRNLLGENNEDIFPKSKTVH